MCGDLKIPESSTEPYPEPSPALSGYGSGDDDDDGYGYGYGYLNVLREYSNTPPVGDEPVQSDNTGTREIRNNPSNEGVSALISAEQQRDLADVARPAGVTRRLF
jgi:hypothetical protein